MTGPTSHFRTLRHTGGPKWPAQNWIEDQGCNKELWVPSMRIIEKLSTNMGSGRAGDDANWQPGDLSDLFMHETVAAWAAKFFKNHPLKDKTLESVR